MQSSIFTKVALRAVVIGQTLLCLAVLWGGAVNAATTSASSQSSAALLPSNPQASFTSTASAASTPTTSSSQPLTLEEKCKQLAEEIQKARDADLFNRLAAQQKAFDAATEQARKKMADPVLRTPLGDIRLTMCFDYMNKFYDAIYGLLSRVNWVITAINAIISQVLNYACNYVATSINNALSNLCIPMPDLSLGSLGLGQKGSKTCDGLSLNDLVYTVTNPPYVIPGTSPAPINPMKYLPNLRSGKPKTGASQ